MDLAESLAIDSLWLSDRVVPEALSLEPVVALSWVAARTRKMKFGTSVLALPLRNPTVLAKELATLDFLSGGRLLLAVGLGRDDDTELQDLRHPPLRADRPPTSALGTAEDIAAAIQRFIDAGASKFVARPACPPEAIQEQLRRLGTEVIPRFA